MVPTVSPEHSLDSIAVVAHMTALSLLYTDSAFADVLLNLRSLGVRV